jgi:hypothetical protein
MWHGKKPPPETRQCPDMALSNENWTQIKSPTPPPLFCYKNPNPTLGSRLSNICF